MDVQWSYELETGFEEIDNQHKELIKKLNELFEAMGKFYHKEEAIQGITVFLSEYVTYHFKSEEALMEKYDYPGMELHKIEHNLLTKSVMDFQQHLNEKGLSIACLAKIQSFLINWFVNHVQQVDKLLAAFLKEAKAKESLSITGK
ncbi:MAG: bacteriohemerythrin [Firmicutes bacterium]|nr:bacteriohemerythrin [Bacillota bacterium]